MQCSFLHPKNYQTDQSGKAGKEREGNLFELTGLHRIIKLFLRLWETTGYAQLYNCVRVLNYTKTYTWKPYFLQGFLTQ